MPHTVANLELSMWEQAQNKSEVFKVFSCFVFVSVFKLQAKDFLTKMVVKHKARN